MADKMKGGRVLFVLFILSSVTRSSVGRIHKLKLENEDRPEIEISTFGFLQKGYLAVNLTDFAINYNTKDDKNDDARTYGFTLDKTVSTGISPHLETKQENCILKDNAIRNDNSVSVLFLRMDLQNSRLIIDRKGTDLKNLQISLLSEEKFASLSRHRRSTDVFSSAFLHGPAQRSRRAADKPEDEVEAAFQEYLKSTSKGHAEIQTRQGKQGVLGVTGAAATEKKTAKKGDETPTGKAMNKIEKTVPQDKSQAGATATPATKVRDTDKAGNKTKDVTSVKPPAETNSSVSPGGDQGMQWVSHYIPMKRHNGRYSTYFLVSINSSSEEGLYNLFFHNCHNYLKEEPFTSVNFTVRITEKNDGNFLSAGQMPLPVLYFALCILYLLTGGYWFYILRSSESGTVFKIHYLMLVLVFVKAIALLFHSINFYFIQKEGHHEEAFAILYYITHLMKGALLFITIVLIGAGWAFVKHILSDRDKKIFIIVIPLQVLANVAQIIIAETEEGQSQYTTWKEVFILVDLLCCGAILFPVVWSIRHLQEASGTDGKAAINLAKLKIFRHFYIMIVCYIYFTRIIVYLLKITVPFQYEWLDELFKELATFIFFIVTGYKFRPASNNPYLQVSTDSDDDIEMDEVVTKSGALDDVVRVNVKSKPSGDHQDSSSTSKRESSHDYD